MEKLKIEDSNYSEIIIAWNKNLTEVIRSKKHTYSDIKIDS